MIIDCALLKQQEKKNQFVFISNKEKPLLNYHAEEELQMI